MSIRNTGKKIEMACRARPIVDTTRSEMLSRLNWRFSEPVASPSSAFGSWMKFLDHFGSAEPIGKSDKTIPRIMHTAMPAGTRETIGRMQVVKLAV